MKKKKKKKKCLQGVVCPYPGPYTCILSQYANIFSETGWPIKAKHYVEHRPEGEMKVCINGQGHMTNIAAMSMNSKKGLNISFFRTRRPMSLKPGMNQKKKSFARCLLTAVSDRCSLGYLLLLLFKEF